LAGNNIVIAECMGFEVKVPKNCWYSFFNSPYPAHRLGSAIDIYFMNNEALFPIDEGVVIDINKFECPKFRSNSTNYDYIIIVQLDVNTALKILHVKPKVNCGDKLFLGDYIGDLIISGYFYPWSNRHMHIEFRPINDAYRALGAYKIDVSPTVKSLINFEGEEDFTYEVYEVYDHYAWLRPASFMEGLPCGLLLNVNDKFHFIDGGIPHYKYGAVLGLFKNSTPKLLYADEIAIGNIFLISDYYCLFKPNCKVFINDLEVMGIGSYINNRNLKVVKINGNWKFNCGDVVKLKFKISFSSP